MLRNRAQGVALSNLRLMWLPSAGPSIVETSRLRLQTETAKKRQSNSR